MEQNKKDKEQDKEKNKEEDKEKDKEKDEKKPKETSKSNISTRASKASAKFDLQGQSTSVIKSSGSILKSSGSVMSKRSIISVTIKKKKPTILILEPISSDGEHEVQLLYDKCNVKFLKKYPAEREEVLESVAGVDGIIMASRVNLDEEIIKAAGKQLKIISVSSTEVDYMELEAAKQLGIHMSTLSKMPPGSRADVAMGLMIGVARCYNTGLSDIERNTWDTNNTLSNLGRDIRGSTVGFIGFGYLSRALEKRLNGFSVEQYLYTDPNDEIGDYKIQKSTLNKLLRESDFIFLCCTLNEKTYHIINEAAFNKMKPTAVLINVLRPKLIDFDAMYDVLDKKKIFGIGLDTFDTDKLNLIDDYLKFKNLMLTPRIAFQSTNASRLFVTIVLNNLLKGLSGRVTSFE